jgi:hypothetical protein
MDVSFVQSSEHGNVVSLADHDWLVGWTELPVLQLPLTMTPSSIDVLE